MFQSRKEVHKVVDQIQVQWIKIKEEVLKNIEDKEDNGKEISNRS